MISDEIEPVLHGYIHKRCKEFGVFVYAVNGIADHRHLVCSIPPTIAVADFVDKIKGASSHYINHVDGKDWSLYWQPGYGGFTFAKKDLARVVAYVENQKKHHAEGTLWPSLERFDDSHKSAQKQDQTPHS